MATEFQWNSPFTGILPYKLTNGAITIHPPKNSGDYLALVGTDGFVEIPANTTLKAGDHLERV